MQITWNGCAFAALSLEDLHDVLALRQRVFIVEQDCAFNDIDGRDPQGYHLLGRDGQGQLMAYARILPPGIYFPERSIGRVVTAPEARGLGLGRRLMQEALRQLVQQFGPEPLRLAAQSHLQRFYGQSGFVTNGAEYIEDGIPHVPMLRDAVRTAAGVAP